MTRAIFAARWILAGLFFYAGVIKLGTSERFAVTVAQLTFIPAEWTTGLTLGLGLTEAAVAVLLVLPRTGRLGAALGAGLLLLFIAALAWALQQGIVMDCGCFGEDPEPSRDKMIVALWRDVGLLALALTLAARRARSRPEPKPAK